MPSNILQIDKTLTDRIKDTMDVEEDPIEIADYLRETFSRDYARRKVSDFRKIVEKICEELKKNDAKEKKGITAAINVFDGESGESPEKSPSKSMSDKGAEAINGAKVNGNGLPTLGQNGTDKSPATSEDDDIMNGVGSAPQQAAAKITGTNAIANELSKKASTNGTPDPNANNSDDSDIICIQEDKSTPAPLYPHRESIDYSHNNINMNTRAPQNTMYMSKEQIAMLNSVNYTQRNLQNLASAGFPVSGAPMSNLTEEEMQLYFNENGEGAQNQPDRKRSKWDQGPTGSGPLAPGSSNQNQQAQNDKAIKDNTNKSSTATRRGRRVAPSARSNAPGNKRRRRKRSASSSSSGSDSDDEDFKMTPKRSHTSLDKDVVLPIKTKNYLKKVLSTLKSVDLFNHLNVSPPRGLLLHGPAGCGKTLLAKSIPNFLDCEYYYISGTELLAGVAGNSEKRIRQIFKTASKKQKCLDENGKVSINLKVVIFDEFDIIATSSKSTKSTPVEKRMVSQLCTCLDELAADRECTAIIVACTSRPEALDSNLRRAGRFDHEVILPIPGEDSRNEILEKICEGVKIEKGEEESSSTINFKTLARLTPGYVGSDLQLLVREAAQVAVGKKLAKEADEKDLYKCLSDEEPKESEKVQEKEKEPAPITMENESMEDSKDETKEIEKEKEPVKEGEAEQSATKNEDDMFDGEEPKVDDKIIEKKIIDFCIQQDDFLTAMGNIVPASKREGFACVPDVTWENIGALEDVREELRLSIVAPIRYPEIFKSYGQTKPPGILLAGPPGNGKTLLAKAVANESGLNFIAVNGPEVLNMYVGESERAVRSVFTRARHSSPCVIFFDEIDALCPKRQSASSGGTEHSARLVNQMLTEMDGIQNDKSGGVGGGLAENSTIFVMAATNRPDMLDPALLRPGRLDKTLFVGLPSQQGKVSILKALTKSKPTVADSVNFEELAKDKRFEKLSGADIASVVREASMIAMHKELERCLKDENYFSSNGEGEQKSQENERNPQLEKEHFLQALDRVKASISESDRKKYAAMENLLKK